MHSCIIDCHVSSISTILMWHPTKLDVSMGQTEATSRCSDFDSCIVLLVYELKVTWCGRFNRTTTVLDWCGTDKSPGLSPGLADDELERFKTFGLASVATNCVDSRVCSTQRSHAMTESAKCCPLDSTWKETSSTGEETAKTRPFVTCPGNVQQSPWARQSNHYVEECTYNWVPGHM